MAGGFRRQTPRARWWDLKGTEVIKIARVGWLTTQQMTRPAVRALFVSAVAIASARLREQGIEHFTDHALACARELA